MEGLYSGCGVKFLAVAYLAHLITSLVLRPYTLHLAVMFLEFFGCTLQYMFTDKIVSIKSLLGMHIHYGDFY